MPPGLPFWISQSFFPCLIDQVSDKSKTEQVAIRRAPRLWAFALTGEVIGFLLSLLAYLFLSQGTGPIFPLIIAFSSVGGGVGISIAVTLDWLFAKKTKRATANRVAK